jgi:hypothetical protein
VVLGLGPGTRDTAALTPGPPSVRAAGACIRRRHPLRYLTAVGADGALGRPAHRTTDPRLYAWSALRWTLPVPLVPSPMLASFPQRRDIAPQWTGTSSAEQHGMDNESIVIKLAEVETSFGHCRVLLTREVIQLA